MKCSSLEQFLTFYISLNNPFVEDSSVPADPDQIEYKLSWQAMSALSTCYSDLSFFSPPSNVDRELEEREGSPSPSRQGTFY